MSRTRDPQIAAKARELRRQGVSQKAIARQLNLSRISVRRLLEEPVNEAMEAVLGVQRDATTGDRREVEVLVDRQVATVEDAIAAAGIDLTDWEVTGMETRHYPVSTKGRVLQGTYVKLRCARRDQLPVAAQVGAIVDGVLAARSYIPNTVAARTYTLTERGALGLVVITDPHFGKLAWAGGTGQTNWDLTIARQTVLASVTWLVSRLPRVERIVLGLLGDVIHYDTLHGTTTSGTTMDRDSRTAKVITVASQTVSEAIRLCAQRAPTDVVMVPGNHDAVLTIAQQRIQAAEFSRDPNVRVDDTFTRRRPYVWGKTLLQFDHGDKARKHLARLLPQEHPTLWGESTYREIHTGHLHQEAVTDQGVIVRTHPALCPPDQWHTEEGFTGSMRGASAFVYRAEGALELMLRFDPRVHMEAENA